MQRLLAEATGTNARLRRLLPGPVIIAQAALRRLRGTSTRATCFAPQRREPTAEHEGANRDLADTRSLRTLAADFGVSDETVRAVVSPPSPVDRVG